VRVAVSIDLSGQVALVTGGATGIGVAVVRAFAASGAAVFFSYTSNADGAQALVQELRDSGVRAGAARADLGQPGAGEALVAACERELGAPHAVVNVAGITDPHPWDEITTETWDRTLDINLRGMFFVCQAAARRMVARGEGGALVLMSSVHGKVSGPQHAHYEASKGGINMVTRSLAIELGGHGIRVNCVAPGAVEVERYAHMQGYDPERWSRAIPLGRMGLPGDIAPLCLFLCSPGASYISGETIYVDGGLTSKMVPL
jgi:NAD(P)-dependent dehydrogenase (short-subunit alcohol dehydrogenase family)